MLETVDFLNLTNGIEDIFRVPNPRFVRIQSTACEQHRWSFIIEDLDYEFLLALAVGKRCIVHDFSHDGDSRALWQGIPWIGYCASVAWLGREPSVVATRGHNVRTYFRDEYRMLSDRAKVKLRYAKKFSLSKDILLEGWGYKTTHDGDYEYYVQLLMQYWGEHGVCR